MKVASPKTLIVSILCGILVIYKALSIDGFTDILWVILLGNLTIQGLKVAFSKEAYDRDIKEAYHKKVLYQRIFGKFAYIAADVPLLMIILAGILAYICPVTSMLKTTLWILILGAAIYAICISLYISRHKRIAVNNGTYESEKLSKEAEKAWNVSERFHNIIYFIAAVFLIFYFIFGNPMIYVNNYRLKSAMAEIDEEQVVLEEIVPFQWTKVYSFGPYYPEKDIEKIVGSESPAIQSSINEGMVNHIFMYHGRVASSVCTYPENAGYSFVLPERVSSENSDFDNYSCVSYGDRIEYLVSNEDGVLKLTPIE